MSIASISSSTASQSLTDLRAMHKQQRSDFQSLSKALQSGDLSAAQTAFAQWQKDKGALTSNPAAAGKPSQASSPLAADILALGSALQSGNINDAQQAMGQLKLDMKAARGARGAGKTESANETENDGDQDDAGASKSAKGGPGSALSPAELLQQYLL